MRNVLITGATGFVGSELIQTLKLDKDINVVRAVRHKEQVVSRNDILIPSIDSNTDWSNLLNGIDTVIHLAAKVHDMKFKEDYSTDNEYFKVNYEGTKQLVNELIKVGGEKIIFLSTIKVNGEGDGSHIYTEKDIPTPVDSYGKSKLEAEKYIINNENKLKYTIIRPGLIVGAGVKGNLFNLMQFIRKGYPFPYIRRENKRSMIGLKNLCNLIHFAIISDKCNNEVLLAAERKPLSTIALINKISSSMGKSIKYIRIPDMISIILFKIGFFKKIFKRLYGDLIINTDKLYSKIGWSPELSIDQEIEVMVNDYLNSRSSL